VVVLKVMTGRRGHRNLHVGIREIAGTAVYEFYGKYHKWTSIKKKKCLVLKQKCLLVR
jgi:hypothetical protein